jgi:antitoxin (DNA-binding transcriptional repressor) of toxin-antitoxin stability system
MIRLNIHEAKTHLSRYLNFLSKGEVILLCKRNKPFAEIRPIAPERKKPRPIGLAKGTFELTPAFFEPLPKEILDAFTGENPSPNDPLVNPPKP